MLATAINAVVGAGGVQAVDLDTRRLGQITLVGQLLATTTPGDITLQAQPYAPDGTLLNTELPIIGTTAAASDGTNVNVVKSYNVTGVEKVRIRLANANVGALTGRVHVFGEYGGRI